MIFVTIPLTCRFAASRLLGVQDMQRKDQWAGKWGGLGAGALEENMEKTERVARGCKGRGRGGGGAVGISRYSVGRQGFDGDTGQGGV
jgi:hypothetical protein